MVDRLRTGSSPVVRRRQGRAAWTVLVAAMAVMFFSPSSTASTTVGQLVNTRIDRRIDLTTQVVKSHITFKMENVGSLDVSEIIIALPKEQAERLAFQTVSISASDRNSRGGEESSLPVAPTTVHGAPASSSHNVAFFSVSLATPLKSGASLSLEVYRVFTRLLQPYPTEISQADPQLVLFHDNHYVLSPYPTKAQVTKVTLFSASVESHTKEEPTKKKDNEITYGFYQNVAPLAVSPMRLHFENLAKFAVVEKLVRDVEVSHWGSVVVREDYILFHGGAKHKGSFSRLEFQVRPGGSAAASFRRLYAKLPPRAFHVYYRDEIGNISSSVLRGDSKKTELELEPRYPLLGGWRVAFTIGYKLPLEDCVSLSADGHRVLKMNFGTAFEELFVEDLSVEIALPEGATNIEAVVPTTLQGAETHHKVKHTVLDTVGRPVIVVRKTNVVAEHNVPFEINYKFCSLAMLREPLMLVAAFAAFFLCCVAYVRSDLTISKTSPAYLAKQQKEEVQDGVLKLRSAVSMRLNMVKDLDASLKELTRKGEEGIAQCKAARVPVEERIKESAKTIKAIVEGLEVSGGKYLSLVAKVKDVVVKEKELLEKAIQKHIAMVDGYEKKLAPREIDQRVEKIQVRLTALKTEVRELLQALED